MDETFLQLGSAAKGQFAMRVKILCPSGANYVRAFSNGVLDAKAASASTWETFELEEFADGRFALKTLPVHPAPGKYVRAHAGGGSALSADRDVANDHEKFTRVDLGNGKVAIRTHAGNLWRAKHLGGAELDCVATTQSTWEVFAIEEVC